MKDKENDDLLKLQVTKTLRKGEVFVENPCKKDMGYSWNGTYYEVPAKGRTILPTHIANHLIVHCRELKIVESVENE